MPSQGKITLEGDRELKRFLADFPPRVARKGLRSAMTAAATPVVKAMRRLVPVATGLTKKNITKKIKTYPNGTVIAVIAVNRETVEVVNGKRRVPSKYWHLIDRGTTAHGYAKRAGSHPGSTGKFFVEAAYSATKDQSASIAISKLQEVVESEAEKLAAK